MTGRSYLIPDELWEKVFLPQPVKSLIQWKSVCKSWNRIITSKSFIKTYGAHQKISENTRRYLLLNHCDHYLDLGLSNPFNYKNFFQCHDFGVGHYDSYYSVGLIDRNSYNVLESYDDICCRDRNGCCLEVYGICDGLLCLSVHDDFLYLNYPVFLYNPFIKKGKKLTSPRLGYENDYGKRCVSLCFGYHDDDYKVIKVRAFPNFYEIYIYSLSTDSWKFIKVEPTFEGTSTESFNIWPYPKARLINGVAYFIQRNEMILFDLGREKFQKKQLPEDMSSAAHVIMEEYEESIALIGSTSHRVRTVYNGVAIGCGVAMWVLKQSDKSYIWEKKFDVKGEENDEMITYLPPIVYPSVQAMGGFVKKNEIVMRRWNTFKLGNFIDRDYFLYNIETGIEKQFPGPQEHARGGFLQRINILTESLVLLTETTMPPFRSLEAPVALMGCNNNVRMHISR